MNSIKIFVKKRTNLITLYYRGLFWLHSFGIEIIKTIKAIWGIPYVIKDFISIKKQHQSASKQWKLGLTMPCFHDRFDVGGVAKGDYFHQDLLVAQKIFLATPPRHVDVGSRVDGFVAHVAAFREIEVFDIRPIPHPPQNISFQQADFMELPEHFYNYCDSLSCLHALEHFGLGRYGDPIDINGYQKGFNSLYHMLRPRGTLYLSVPIGTERIDFNAHRVFAISSILNLARDKLKLISFSYVDDQGDLQKNIILDENSIANSFNLYYGCGIFEFQKIATQ